MLSKSQRLSLISQLATHFSAQSYQLIDTAFEIFEIEPTKDLNQGGQHAYVLATLKSGVSDAILIELAEYAGIPDPNINKDLTESEIVTKGRFRSFRLFISHLSTHRKLAGEIKTKLIKYGIHSFVAHNDIKPTMEWQKVIEERLTKCDALVALLHEGFKESNWTDQEIGWVKGQSKPVFAVAFDLVPYGFFGHVQAFNGVGKTSTEIADEIFAALARNETTKVQLSYAVVDRFHKSDTFLKSKHRSYHLSEIQYWNEELELKVTDAIENNSQISGSYGVPDRVKRILSKRSQT